MISARGGRIALLGVAGAFLAYVISCPEEDDAAPSAPTPGLKYVTARPAPLVPGTTYFGRAKLGWAASLVVTNNAVRSNLQGKGFTNVMVYSDSSDLPASWPEGERTGNLFVEATYSGSSTTMAVPSQVLSIWTDPGATA